MRTNPCWRRSALIGAAAAMLAFSGGCRQQTGDVDEAGREAHVANADGSLFAVRRGVRRFALHLPGFWSATSQSSSNAKTGDWKTHVVLSAPGKPDVTIQSTSSNPELVAIGGTVMNLADGAFFRLRADGALEQLPLVPMPEIDQTDLEQLNTLCGVARP